MGNIRQTGADMSGGGREFLKTGRWASERLIKALNEGRPITTAELRTLDTLRKDEWIHLDEALVEEGIIRLRGVADLVAAGLVVNVPNAMGKTIFQWENVSDMEEAQISLSGVSTSEGDRQEFDLKSMPLPIVHKDFPVNIRALAASRSRGEALDDSQARVAGRLVGERIEKMLFQGGPTYGGNAIYGYTNHPNRNEVDFENNKAWDDATKTGEGILTDVLAAIQKLEEDRFGSGPYWIYVPAGYSTVLEKDFKANSDKTIRQRLLEVDRVEKVVVADQCPAGKVVVVQATRDVVAMVNGEPLQTVQWDLDGGFTVRFKAFAIQVPLIRADQQNRSGVCIILQL